MTITLTAETTTATVAFESQEWAVLQEILRAQPEGLRFLIRDWLKIKRDQMLDAERLLLKNRMDTVTAAQVKQIKLVLGL